MGRIPDRPPPSANVPQLGTPKLDPEQSHKRKASPAPLKDSYESARANTGAALFGAPANLPNARGMGDVKVAERQADQKDLASRMETLGVQTYPWEKHPGNLHEAETIRSGAEPRVWTKDHTEQVSGGDSPRYEAHPQMMREVPQYMLENTLQQYTRGEPLTPFEKKMIAEWGKHGTLTPICESAPPHELVGYKTVKMDGPFERSTYYDRQGNELGRAAQGKGGHAESVTPPWEYLNLARAGVGLAKHAAGKVATKVAKPPTPSGTPSSKPDIGLASTKPDIGRASTKPDLGRASTRPDIGRAGTQPDIGRASTQTDVGRANTLPAAAGASTQASTSPPTGGAQTAASRTDRTVGSKSTPAGDSRPPQAAAETPMRTEFRGGRHHRIADIPGDSIQVTVRTPKGLERIAGREYRLRVYEAENWVHAQPGGLGKDPARLAELQKEATGRFKLDDGWWKGNFNPLLNRILRAN